MTDALKNTAQNTNADNNFTVGKPLQNSFKRVEQKYMLSRLQYELLLQMLKPYMIDDEYAYSDVCSLYYDTDSFDLIRRSIEKPVYKEKFRVRSYGKADGSSQIFAEIKKKYDGIVYKRRIADSFDKVDDLLEGLSCGSVYKDINDANDSGAKDFDKDRQIKNEIGDLFRRYELKPQIFIGYRRYALKGKDDPGFRITFDTDLIYRTDRLDLREDFHGERLLEDDVVLMEVKIAGAAPLWLSSIFSKLKIYRTSFSKVGTAYTRFVLPEKFGGSQSQPAAADDSIIWLNRNITERRAISC